jgi:hypothetical protein
MAERRRAGERPDTDDVEMGLPIGKSHLSEDRKRLYDRIEQINRSWLDSMQQMRRAEAEFSVRLFTCRNPDDALVLCNQWMAKRLEILATEQQLFARCWSELVVSLGKPLPAPEERIEDIPLRRRASG